MMALSTEAHAGSATSVRRCPISLSRPAFLAAAVSFSLLVRVSYVEFIAGSGAYAYMGIRAQDVSMGVTLVSLLLAVLPSLWLPCHLRRPTDCVALYIFYAVHVPTCMLLPLVSHAPLASQFTFASAVALATCALAWRVPVPHIVLPELRNRRLLFGVAVFVICVCVLVVFAKSGYLTLSNLQFVEVYAQRLELMARSAELGRLFFYAANWTASALVPFLLIAGIYSRNFLSVSIAVLLATLAFIVSSNKVAYAMVPAITGAYYSFKWTRGRHLGAWMGAAFTAMGITLIGLDLMGGAGSDAGFPLTWGVFFRTFGNNGFLSAVYFDLFTGLPPALFTDSFMRILLASPLEMSVPALAGASFSEVPDVHANANLWADGYANLHYFGLVFAVFCGWITFWVYESITRRHDRVVAATGLVAYAFTLANTSVHIAVISNGFFVMCFLLYAWPGGRKTT